jgi:xanthine dehydrogenase small subunit
MAAWRRRRSARRRPKSRWPRSRSTIRKAADKLAEDFRPIDDHRASAHYRNETARNLLIKALTEIAGEATVNTRIVGVREPAYAR